MKRRIVMPGSFRIGKIAGIDIDIHVSWLPGGLRYALVMQADHLVGLMTLSDIRHIPREQWGQVPVSTAMIPLSRLHVATPQQSLSDVLPFMAGRDVNQLPVVQNGTLVGIVSRDAIVQYLEVRRSLGLGAAKGDVRKQLPETDL